MNENRAGLGYQDFEEVRKKHIFYIDKTDFIREWWENADKVTLITRPRRFGKTLNMSMTECFFQINIWIRVIYLKDCPFGKRNFLTENISTGSFRERFQ